MNVSFYDNIDFPSAKVWYFFWTVVIAVSALACHEHDKVEKAHLPWWRMGCEKILNLKKWVRTEVKGLFF